MWCGPKNCLSHPNLTTPVFQCETEQTCVVQTHMTCLTPPCVPFGECRDLQQVNDIPNPGKEWTCIPNQAHLGSNCAKIILIFDKSKMPLVSMIKDFISTVDHTAVDFCVHSLPSGKTVQIVNNGSCLPFCSIQCSRQRASGN